MNQYTTPEGAKVEETDNGFTITYVIWGDEEQRQAEAARLLDLYPKAGYGTSVYSNGVTTTVDRYPSCE